MFGNLLKTTELVGGRTRIGTQVYLLWNLCSLSLECIPSLLLIVSERASVLRREANLYQVPEKKQN